MTADLSLVKFETAIENAIIPEDSSHQECYCVPWDK